MADPRDLHRIPLTRRESLLFEAGIKLGGIFHQYLGIPVSASSAPGLARTIERAVGLQPYVVSVRVAIDPSRAGPLGKGRLAYAYLTPQMLDVKLRLVDGPVRVDARLSYRSELRYPLMHIESISAPGKKTPTRGAGRSARR